MIFIEVRMRHASACSVLPRETIDRRKIDKIRRTALCYAVDKTDQAFRFDVVEIIQGLDWRQYTVIQNAFSF
jgi:Holliday junction resolvase-like predicted endonuclease